MVTPAFRRSLENGWWRSGRDSNPRYGFAVYSLSRRAPSTTRPPLRMSWRRADLVSAPRKGKPRDSHAPRRANLVQLEPRPNHRIDLADDDERDALEPAVHGDQVQPIERGVDEARQPPLDRHAAADEIAHQAADRREAAERDQRAVVLVGEGAQRAPVHHPPGMAEGEAGHLVRGLRPRRHRRPRPVGPAPAAVADRQDAFVTAGLERVPDHQLAIARGFEPADMGEAGGALHARRPDH